MAFLVDDLLLGPIKLIKWLGEKVKEAAEREMTDEDAVRREILELQVRYELEDITGEELASREKELMEELESIRRYHEGNSRS